MKRHNVRVTDPPMTRKKGLFTHFGSWVYLALGILFVAYIFGVIPHDLPDQIFAAISAQRDHVFALSAFVIPAGFLLGLFVVLYLFLRMTRNLTRAVKSQTVTLPAPVTTPRPQPKTSQVIPIESHQRKSEPGRTETLPRPANPHHAAEPADRSEHKS